jgi:hypothetical protein
MAKGIRKGTELNNIRETWDQNERNLQDDKSSGSEDTGTSAATGNEDLNQIIKEEAKQYDNENKLHNTLDGERASISDDVSKDSPDE